MIGNYAYMLRCSDGTLYAGWTTDLDRRVDAHNAGTASRYTRSRLPVQLVKHWEFSSRSEAMRFEIYLKKLSRSEKLELLNDQSFSLTLESPS